MFILKVRLKLVLHDFVPLSVSHELREYKKHLSSLSIKISVMDFFKGHGSFFRGQTIYFSPSISLSTTQVLAILSQEFTMLFKVKFPYKKASIAIFGSVGKTGLPLGPHMWYFFFFLILSPLESRYSYSFFKQKHRQNRLFMCVSID